MILRVVFEVGPVRLTIGQDPAPDERPRIEASGGGSFDTDGQDDSRELWRAPAREHRPPVGFG